MALDRSKLENVKKRADGAFTARCPACADTGGDQKGEHLIVYKDGQFACVVYPGTAGKQHRAEIVKMVGDGARNRQVTPKPIAIRRPVIEPSRTLLVLGRLGRTNSTPDKKSGESAREVELSPSTPKNSSELENTRPERPASPEELSEFLQTDGEPAPPDFMPPMSGGVALTEQDAMDFLNG